MRILYPTDAHCADFHQSRHVSTWAHTFMYEWQIVFCLLNGSDIEKPACVSLDVYANWSPISSMSSPFRKQNGICPAYNLQTICVNRRRKKKEKRSQTVLPLSILYPGQLIIIIKYFLKCSQSLINRLQNVQNNAASSLILKAPRTDHITAIFALCTGFLSIVRIYSRSTRPPSNFDLPQTAVYCAFHQSTLSCTANVLSFTLLQHSGTHF